MKYAGLIENDIADSINGISVSFWVQGCPFRCKGCHNQQTWDFNGGLDLPDDYLQKISEAISANGVTRNLSILGGEPLCQQNINLVASIVCYIRSQYSNITIYLWTGYTLSELNNIDNKISLCRILNNIDYLIDGRYNKDLRDVTLKLRGSSNQNVYHITKDDNGNLIYNLENS